MAKSYMETKIWLRGDDYNIDFAHDFESYGEWFYSISIGNEIQIITPKIDRLEKLRDVIQKVIDKAKAREKEANAVNS